MKWVILLLALMTSASAQLGGTGIGNGFSGCPVQLGTDSNGWTVFPTASSGQLYGRIYYVSTNDGNDSNSGLSSVPNPSGAGGVGPKKTLASTMTAILAFASSSGHSTAIDSWMLLKKGDRFVDQTIGGSLTGINGVDCLHPFIISSYDPAQPGAPDPYGNVAVASIACSSTTATVTTASAHGWVNGNPYRLTLTKELPGGFNGEVDATITGTTTFTYTVSSCPAASDTAHGIVSLSRPRIEPNVVTQNVCFASDAGTKFDYLAITGLHCYNYKLDPNNASWDKAQYSKTFNGVSSLAPNVWRLYENNKFEYVLSLAMDQESPAALAGTLSMRRNVSYNATGSYISSVLHLSVYQNITLYDGWSPNLSAGTSVSVATGSPGVITWVNNPLVSSTLHCSIIKFTGSVLPTGIVSGTAYYVVGSSGDTFSVDTSCVGSGLTLSGSPSAVSGYWNGTYNCGFACQYPQPLVNIHSYYLQNAAQGNGVWDIKFSGNISGFTAGPSCQCGGEMFENVFFQNTIPIATGKSGELPSVNNFNTTYNGIFNISPQYNTPAFIDQGTEGIAVGGRVGTYTIANNLIAYQTGSFTAQIGILPADLSNYPSTSPINSNVVCGITNPIRAIQGKPVLYDTIVGGSGYTPVVATTNIFTWDQAGIPLVGGSGINGGVSINVNGTTGAVVAVILQYNMNGRGYQVGDIVTVDNSYLGGSGSGFSARIASVTGIYNGFNTFDTIVGGSGYRAQVLRNLGGGTGAGGQGLITISAGGSVQAVQAYDGRGYVVGDVLTVPNGTGGTARVAAVINNSFSSNTYKAANCNNLQNATGGGGGTTGLPASFAPPLTPSVSPPTDVIGSYFQSLAYGYQATVPTILASVSTDWEQGYIDAAKNQQKSNWDTNLMASSIMAWARPQFGMTNPP